MILLDIRIKFSTGGIHNKYILEYPSVVYDDEHNVLSLNPFRLETLARESCLRQLFLTQLRAHLYQLCLPDSGSIFLRSTQYLPTPPPSPAPSPAPILIKRTQLDAILKVGCVNRLFPMRKGQSHLNRLQCITSSCVHMHLAIWGRNKYSG